MTQLSQHKLAINVSLVAALVLFAVGLFAPLLTFRKFFIFSDTVSLASALWQLLQEGHVPLFLLIAAFSVVFPLAKLGLLFKLCNGSAKSLERYYKSLHWLGHYGKWSMLDVFVVAVLIVVVKMGDVASVQVHIGLYAFGGSVLLTGLVTSRVAFLIRRMEATGAPGGSLWR